VADPGILALAELRKHPERYAGAQGPKGDDGADGDRGPAGPPGRKGDPGLVWRGPWQPDTAYVKDDAVQVQGSSYVAIGPSRDQKPPSPAWDLVAKKGRDGQDGMSPVNNGGGGGSGGGSGLPAGGTEGQALIKQSGVDGDADWESPQFVGGQAIYGDGHHGSPVLDGIAEFDFATLAGSEYTLGATLYAEAITVEAGITVNTNNWPIYARGTLTNEGVIHADGGTDSDSAYAALIRGADGGNGGVGDSGGFGAGFYKAEDFGTGGDGGAVPNFSGGSGAIPDPWWLIQRSAFGGGSITPQAVDVDGFGLNKVRTPYAGGNGGGGGAGQAGRQGGTGGVGGNVVLIVARTIVNNGTIRSLGGDGLPAQDATAYPDWAAATGYGTGERIKPTTHVYSADNDGTSDAAPPTWTDDGSPVTDNDITWTDLGVQAGGGGGGGQGGWVILVYDLFSGTVPDPTVDCVGGAGGAGAGGGSDGDPGDDGNLVRYANTAALPSNGGATVEVTEQDAAPAVTTNTIRFPNGSVTDDGSGVVSVAFEVDLRGTADPSAGGGVAAAIGTMYRRDNAGTGELWFKTGAADTDWTQVV
jgi:hypothetical protein